MKNRRNNKLGAIVLLMIFVFEITHPTISYALTDGPSSPEFTSFEPVSTTDIVNLSSGKFVYNLPVINIPGAEGGGYSMSLSYHSGVNCEQEASWVGFGWTLNPGALNRSVNGYPDDFDGQHITKFTKAIPVWTITKRLSGNLELLSNDLGENNDEEGFSANYGIGGSITRRYNNYVGFGRTTGYNLSVRGVTNISEPTTGELMSLGTLGLNLSGEKDGRRDWRFNASVTISPKNIITSALYKSYCNNPTDRRRERLMENLAKRGGQEKDVTSFTPSVYNAYHAISKTLRLESPRYKGYNFNGGWNFTPVLGGVPWGIQIGKYESFTIQYPVKYQHYSAYGYLHNRSIGTYNTEDESPPASGDFSLERDISFTLEQDKFLPLPYHSNDVFILTGSGVLGSFRFHRNDLGHYYPTIIDTKSRTQNFGFGFDIGMGDGLSIGTSISFNLGSTSEVKSWNYPGDSENLQFGTSTESFARMDGDLSGSIKRYDHEEDNLESGVLQKFPDDGLAVGLISELTQNPSLNEEYAASTYINKLTLSEANLIKDQSESLNISNNLHPMLMDLLEETDLLASESSIIAGFQITNPSGIQYNYGAPLLNHQELNIAIDDAFSSYIGFDNEVVYLTETHDNQSSNGSQYSYTNLLTNKKIVSGYLNDNFYSGTHLLTSVLNTNYYDITGDGPSEDDLGGYTYFDYRKVYGVGVGVSSENQHNWYKWRTPYSGGYFSRNELPSQIDDRISVSAGLKEVAYLKKVETKTHVAYFITNHTLSTDFAEEDFVFDNLNPDVKKLLEGSQKVRYDGFGAVYSPDNQSDDRGIAHHTNSRDLIDDSQALTHYDNPSSTLQPVENLERIVLFSKNDFNEPIKTVNFEYDNSLSKNLPNNIFGNWPQNNDIDFRSGKLTLKKVWFDYGGVISARTSPYEFGYSYSDVFGNTDIPKSLASQYPDLKEFVNKYSSEDQNPNYSPYIMDAWGGIEYDFMSRKQNLQSWKYQGKINHEVAIYDPAAWHLKQIKLPSGGQIHIHYEEADYSYVQNKQAMAMVSIKDHESNTNSKFALNLIDLGIDLVNDSQSEFDQKIHLLQEKLTKKFITDGEWIRYRFLFSLTDDSDATLNGCSAYVDGYMKVQTITREGNELFIEGDSDSDYLPKTAAYYDFLDKYGGVGNEFSCQFEGWNPYGVGDIVRDNVYDKYQDEDCLESDNSICPEYLTPPGAFKDLLNLLPTGYTLPNFFDDTNINFELSYLRIPIIDSKRGGGQRVKRILSYDPGIIDSAGEERIYGIEYAYELDGGSSSGVANNEPQSIKIENPLVNLIPRVQKDFDRALNGKDLQQHDGPIGEMHYGMPNIVYSKVTVESINNYSIGSNDEKLSSPTATGYTEHEFYTSFDHPLLLEPFSMSNGEQTQNPTTLNKGEDDHVNINKLYLPLPFLSINRRNVKLTQGYLFKINDFHGTPKSVTTFSGTKLGGAIAISAGKRYEYFDPGEEVPVLYYDKDSPNPYKVCKKLLGVEIERAMYMDRIIDKNNQLSIEFDITISFVPAPKVIPTFSTLQLAAYKTEISRHVTNKVVKYGLIPKGVKEFKNNQWIETENLAFDEQTGSPIIVKVTDEFKRLSAGTEQYGEIYYTTIPAHMIYEELGQKSKNPDFENRLTAQAATIISYGTQGNPIPDDITTEYSEAPWFNSPNNVIRGNSTIFKKNWFNSSEPDLAETAAIEQIEEAYINESSEILSWLNARWLPAKSYQLKEDLIANMLNFESGTTGITSIFNNWDDLTPETNQDKWQGVERIAAYDMYGRPISTILDLKDDSGNKIYKSVKYGYNGDLPVIIANNSEYSSILFEGFEIDGNVSNGHTGSKSFNLSSTPYINGTLKYSNDVDDGLEVLFWTSAPSNESQNLKCKINGIFTPLKTIAMVEGWILMSGIVKDWSGYSSGDELSLTISYTGNNSSIALDDLKVCSANSSSRAYVYDPSNYRLIAEINDQNFASVYQYDDEGRLVRRLIETERGIQVVSENEYNSPSVQR